MNVSNPQKTGCFYPSMYLLLIIFGERFQGVFPSSQMNANFQNLTVLWMVCQDQESNLREIQ